MGLYNFQPRFVDFILRGKKTHTIRAVRVHPDKPGNVLHLYSGLRTKKAKLLLRVPCVKIEQIKIMESFELDPAANQTYFGRPRAMTPQVWISSDFDANVEWNEKQQSFGPGDTVRLSWDERQALARRDGFKDFAEMMKFWDGRLPFTGHIIHWRFHGDHL